MEGRTLAAPFDSNLTPPRRTIATHLDGHTDEITAVAVSPDGQFAITGSIDRTLECGIWSAVLNSVYFLDTPATSLRWRWHLMDGWPFHASEDAIFKAMGFGDWSRTKHIGRT
ncbi:MAG: hypothetical protein HS126_40065 [Anaerolineales bacterium]|nr:hypothetical protein [Anaerolineales bacterium]